jgi:Alfin
MDPGGPRFGGSSPEEIFKDFKARRAGILKALTTGSKLFLFLSVVVSIVFHFFLDLVISLTYDKSSNLLFIWHLVVQMWRSFTKIAIQVNSEYLFPFL